MAHLLSLIRVAVAEKKRASGEQAPSAEDEATIDGCHVSGARIVRRKRTVRLMVAVGGSHDGVVLTPGGTPMSQQENGLIFGSWAVNVAGTPSVSECVVEAIDEGTRNTDEAFDVLTGDSMQAVHQSAEGDSGVCGRTSSKPKVTTRERLLLEFDCEHELSDTTTASVFAAIPIVGDTVSMDLPPRHSYTDEQAVNVKQGPSKCMCTNGYQTSNESVPCSDSKPNAKLTSTIFPSITSAQLGMLGYSTKARRRCKVSLGLSNGKHSDNGGIIPSDIDSATAATSKRMSLTAADTTRTESSNTTYSQTARSMVHRDHLASNATEMTELSTDEKATELVDADREQDTETLPTSSYAGLLTSQQLDTFIVERMLSGRHPCCTQCKTRGWSRVGVDIHRDANSVNYLGHPIDESRPNATGLGDAGLDLSCGMLQPLTGFTPTAAEKVTARCKKTRVNGKIVLGGKPCQQFNDTVSDTSKRCGCRKRRKTTLDRDASVRYRRRKNGRTPFPCRAHTSFLQNNTGVSRAYRNDRVSETAYICNKNGNCVKTTLESDATDNCAACTQNGVRTSADRPDQFEVFGAGLHHGYVQAKNIFQVGHIGLIVVNFIDVTIVLKKTDECHGKLTTI